MKITFKVKDYGRPTRQAPLLETRFVGKDCDHMTTAHDKIALWLAENPTHVFNQLRTGNTKLAWDRDDAIAIARRKCPDIASAALEALLEELPPLPPSDVVVDVEWELPVQNGSYLVGVIDLVYRISTFRLSLENAHSRQGRYWDAWTSTHAWAFEVKSHIKSWGDLLRQIQLYRTYFPADFCVVAPAQDARWVAQLKSQDIEFLEVPSGVLSGQE